MKELLAYLKKQNVTIASVESLTAGLFTSQLAEVPGASAVLKGGIVTYMTEIKERVVGVDARVIETYGVVSKECAREMAVKGKEIMHSDICVSFTGNAGPDVMEDKPAGYVCMAIAHKDEVQVMDALFSGTRNEVRQQSVDFMVKKLKKIREM